VQKTKENEEILKEKIFSVYSSSINEINRQQVFLGQLSSLIYNWCRDYLNFDVNDMGVEIAVVTKRLLKEKSNTNIPNDKESFLKYLITSLKRGKYEYIRQYEKKNQDDLIRMKESNLGRKLTENEQLSFINKWYDYDNAIKIIGTSLTGTNNYENPQTDYLNSEKTAIILEAINSVLAKKQDRSRNCYKALLTLHCIDNVDLHSVLDSKIIEEYRQRTDKPTQYEIYQRFHQKLPKSSLESMASTDLKKLLSDLSKYLKENNPEIFN